MFEWPSVFPITPDQSFETLVTDDSTDGVVKHSNQTGRRRDNESHSTSDALGTGQGLDPETLTVRESGRPEISIFHELKLIDKEEGKHDTVYV